MSRLSVTIRLAAAVGLTVLGLWPAPPAQASEETVEVRNLAEAWYVSPTLLEGLDLSGLPDLPTLPDIQIPDTCDLPIIGCLPLDVLLPFPLPSLPEGGIDLDELAALLYPPDTLVVEATAGQATAKSFLVPDLTRVPDGATLTGGTLTLPLNDDPLLAGNRGVAQAEFEACFVTTEVTDGARGRLFGAPKYDCKTSSAARFERKLDRFTIDLEPFVERWLDGEPNYGVALVPVQDLDPQSTWHVTFNGSGLLVGEATRSSLAYTIEDAPTEEPTQVPIDEPIDVAVPIVPPSTGGGVITPPPPVAEAPASVEPPVAPEVPVAEQPLEAAPYALLNSPWYTYRGVVLLPLAFLIAMSLTGRSLTRPLAGPGRART